MRLAIIFTMMLIFIVVVLKNQSTQKEIPTTSKKPTGRASTSLKTRAARVRARGSKNARRVKPSKTGADMPAECGATGPRTTTRGRLRRSRGSTT